MEYRQLGHAGVRISVIGLGTNRFGSEALPQVELSKIIDAALELGINFIDTANTLEHMLHNAKAASWGLSEAELTVVNALLE